MAVLGWFRAHELWLCSCACDIQGCDRVCVGLGGMTHGNGKKQESFVKEVPSDEINRLTWGFISWAESDPRVACRKGGFKDYTNLREVRFPLGWVGQNYAGQSHVEKRSLEATGLRRARNIIQEIQIGQYPLGLENNEGLLIVEPQKLAGPNLSDWSLSWTTGEVWEGLGRALGGTAVTLSNELSIISHPSY